MIIVGNGLLSRDDTKSLLNYIQKLLKNLMLCIKDGMGLMFCIVQHRV